MDSRLKLDVEELASKRVKRRKKRDLNQPIYYDINDKKVSVFTPEFLEENRILDSDLRQLRKLNNDYEEHNSVLAKYIDTLTSSCQETAEQINELTSHRETLKSLLDEIGKQATGGCVKTETDKSETPSSQITTQNH